MEPNTRVTITSSSLPLIRHCLALERLDNAAMESFFGTLKSEWLYFHRFEIRQQAMSSIFYFIETFYNLRRLHSTIGYQSSLAFEQAAHLKEQSDLNLSPL
jgi:transposase InsO family protein